MFEDRTMNKRRRHVLYLLLLLFVGVAFGVGFFFNLDTGGNIAKDGEEPDDTSFKIPDSLKNPTPKPVAIPEVEGVAIEESPVTIVPYSSDTFPDAHPSSDIGISIEPVSETSNISSPGTPTVGTKLTFNTEFTLCGHKVIKDAVIAEDERSMTREELQKKYANWDIIQYTPQQIILSRKIDRYCPNHFIVGTRDGVIAIYVYDENGNKLLRNKTDISVEIVPPEDHKKLQSGIVADTEEELDEILEGFSD